MNMNFILHKLFGGKIIEKILAVIIFVLLMVNTAEAVVVTGIYTGGCDRKLGVILKVDSYSIYFLNLNGRIEKLPRHQSVQLVNYPVDTLPQLEMDSKGEVGKDISTYRVYFLKNQKEALLTEGFPINFTEEKIAFLTKNGSEELIDKKNISSLTKTHQFRIESVKGLSKNVAFAPSYTFMHCGTESGSAKGTILIQPTQVLSEPLTIKKELDRLQKGHDLVENYIEEQDFYSTPLVFGRKTQLGMWFSAGSRHGSSSTRANNFTPVLQNEVAEDIFGFQRILITGAAPNSIFEHEEAQTQAYYAFKASYFHFLAFMDPSLLLVGKKYDWQEGDLGVSRFAFHPVAGMGFGFDIGNWQVGLLLNSLDLGVGYNNESLVSHTSLQKLHVTYTLFNHRAEVLFGGGTGDFQANSYLKNTTVSHYRLNYYYQLTSVHRIGASIISNSFSMNRKENLNASVEVPKALDSQIVAAQWKWNYNPRITLESLAGLEQFKEFKNSGTGLKLGSSIHLSF